MYCNLESLVKEKNLNKDDVLKLLLNEGDDYLKKVNEIKEHGFSYDEALRIKKVLFSEYSFAFLFKKNSE